MSRSFWDSQFRFSEIVPGFAGLLERAAADSADWAAGRSFEKLAYGRHPRQWAEIAHGSGTLRLLPVIVHGGYWRALRAQDHRFLMKSLTAIAPAVANVEYRLMPRVRLADVVADVRTALAALANRHSECFLLPIGHSAGAHLALSAIADPSLRERVRGVIALSGVYDLHPVTLSFLQDELHLSPAEVARYTLRPSSDRPPVLYVNGSDETYEFLRGSALMASAGRAAHRILPGADHMSLLWSACRNMGGLIETLTSPETAI